MHEDILTSLSVTCFGLVFSAEYALQRHEILRRHEETMIRREARYDLARRGLVGTETEIAKWRVARERESADADPDADP